MCAFNDASKREFCLGLQRWQKAHVQSEKEGKIKFKVNRAQEKNSAASPRGLFVAERVRNANTTPVRRIKMDC